MALLTTIFSLKRWDEVKFLHPVSQEALALWVGKKQSEKLSWISFFKPFRNDVWRMIAIMTVLMLGSLQLIKFIINQANFTLVPLPKFIYNTCQDLWLVFSLFVGNSPSFKGLKLTESIKSYFFVTCLLGSFIFMCYRSSLTSELSVRRIRDPFNGLKGLIDSNFKFVKS